MGITRFFFALFSTNDARKVLRVHFLTETQILLSRIICLVLIIFIDKYYSFLETHLSDHGKLGRMAGRSRATDGRNIHSRIRGSGSASPKTKVRRIGLEACGSSLYF